MGMFDSLYADKAHTADSDGWQTKAYDCQLDKFFIGDKMPPVTPETVDYQVEILGETPNERFCDSLATVRRGFLVALHVDRDASLPLFNYSGHLVDGGAS